MMLEALPFIQTGEQTEDVCRLLAAEMFVQMKVMRAQFAITGQRPPEGMRTSLR
ncbi:MAG: hypothetical protein JWO65_1461 [Sphingomonas bacterium]|nr:hypothetical protein [Sphingomonas bacterium]